MKRWIKRSLFAALGLSVLVAGLSACGHRDHEFGTKLSAQEYTEKRTKIIERVAGKLDLDAEQKARLGVLGDKLYDQRTALIGQTTDPRAELRAMVASDKFDRTRAQALVSEKTAVLQARSPDVIVALADFYDSLNPAQQQKVRDFLEGRHGWFHRG